VSRLQCVAVCCSVLQCLGCSVLQCVKSKKRMGSKREREREREQRKRNREREWERGREREREGGRERDQFAQCIFYRIIILIRWKATDDLFWAVQLEQCALRARGTYTMAMAHTNVIRLIHSCVMTHTHICVMTYTHICVMTHTHICVMAHTHICVMTHTHICVMTHTHTFMWWHTQMCYDSFIHVCKGVAYCCGGHCVTHKGVMAPLSLSLLWPVSHIYLNESWHTYVQMCHVLLWWYLCRT